MMISHHVPVVSFSVRIVRYLQKQIHIMLLLSALLLFSLTGCTGKTTVMTDGVINVVACENFWGSIAAQLGGSRVNVTSLVNAPNADPHEYETTTTDARIVARANYVILNGAGYDSWGQKILDANPVNGRKILNVADLLNKKQGDNPHFWYSPDYVDRVVIQIIMDYQEISPQYTEYFNEQYAAFQNELSRYHQIINTIKQNYAGVKIGATESIFIYMADALNLNLITPSAFMNAVSASNEPPAAALALFQQQINEKQIALLIYNAQTATLITTNIKTMTEKSLIPTIGITETIKPPEATFQDWQIAQLQELNNVLSKDD